MLIIVLKCFGAFSVQYRNGNDWKNIICMWVLQLNVASLLLNPIVLLFRHIHGVFCSWDFSYFFGLVSIYKPLMVSILHSFAASVHTLLTDLQLYRQLLYFLLKFFSISREGHCRKLNTYNTKLDILKCFTVRLISLFAFLYLGTLFQ